MKNAFLSGAAFVTIGVLLSATPTYAATVAQEPAPHVVAIAQPHYGLTILANRINGITITGHAGGVFTAKAAGHVTKTVTARANSPVIIDQLDAGSRYQVLRNGKRIGFANVVGQVGPTQELLVETTDNPDEVSLSWKHIVNKGEGAPVSFTATATIGNSKNATSRIVTTDSHAILKGLNKNERYTFTVTASNSASIGRASVAVMQQTLSQISGNFAEQASGPVTTVQVSAPPFVPAEAPAPASPPAPAPGPTTKTIYICPDGYTDAGSLCEKLMAYTFHNVTTTSPYTYHPQFVQTGSHITFTSDGSNGGTYYGPDQWNPSDGSPAGFYAVIPDGYTITVKDNPPTGFTDDGSKYTKIDKVKDATPPGYTDSGTSWVTTTSKVAKVVPV